MTTAVTDTRIVDVQIPFWSMTVLLFKIALAMIPAAILLAIAGTMILTLLNGIGGI